MMHGGGSASSVASRATSTRCAPSPAGRLPRLACATSWLARAAGQATFSIWDTACCPRPTPTCSGGWSRPFTARRSISCLVILIFAVVLAIFILVSLVRLLVWLLDLVVFMLLLPIFARRVVESVPVFVEELMYTADAVAASADLSDELWSFV